MPNGNAMCPEFNVVIFLSRTVQQWMILFRNCNTYTGHR